MRGHQGQGRDVLMTRDGGNEVATATSQGVGKIINSGAMHYVGANFYTTSSSGKLVFLNNLVGMFEAAIEESGNYTVKVWEWK